MALARVALICRRTLDVVVVHVPDVGGDADAGEDPFRRAQLADLAFKVGFEKKRRRLVVHGADEIDAVRAEPFRPVLRDGLAGDFEIGEDGDGHFDGGAGGFGGRRAIRCGVDLRPEHRSASGRACAGCGFRNMNGMWGRNRSGWN